MSYDWMSIFSNPGYLEQHSSVCTPSAVGGETFSSLAPAMYDVYWNTSPTPPMRAWRCRMTIALTSFRGLSCESDFPQDPTESNATVKANALRFTARLLWRLEQTEHGPLDPPM